jgi:gliding motility-associated-like protein
VGRFKTTVLLILLLLFCRQSNAQIVWADSCVTSSFYGKVSARFSSFSRVDTYPGGDIIAVGAIQAFDSVNKFFRTYGLLLRVNASGKIVWSRFVGVPHSLYREASTGVYASVVCRNGDIVIATHNSMLGEPGGNIILRFSGSGDLLWTKRINESSYGFMIEDIIETSDGGLLMCGPSSSVGTVMKLDALGNFKWYQVFANFTYVNCRSIAESPTAYYATGYSYEFGFESSRNFLMKLDKQTGDTIWVKSFGDASKAEGSCEYAFAKMTYRDGLLHLVGSTSVNYRGPNPLAQVTASFDENGQLVSAMRMENSSVPMAFTAVFEGSLYDPYEKTGVQYWFSDTSDFYVFKLNKDNTARWAWRLPVTGLELANDCTIGSDTSLIVAGFNRTSDGENGALIKLGREGRLENCSNIPVSFKAIPVSIAAHSRALQTSKNITDSTRVTSLTAMPGYGFSFNLLCSDVNGCHLSKIMGASIVCSGGSYLYKVSRKGNFVGSVRFTNTGNATVSVVSDTSVELTFPKAGAYKLVANLDAACRTLQDSLIIIVSDGASSLTLGPDTTLCTGSKITLQPNGAYVNYLWQDGSTASSYEVSGNGLYNVTVTDACGNIFEDAVLINEVSSVPIDIGPDRTKCNTDTLHLTAPSGFLNYQWSNNYNISSVTAQTVIVNPLTDTAYYVRAEKTPGCFAYDTVRVHVNTSPAISLGADKSFCSGDSAELDAGSGFSQYIWKSGSSAQQISVKTAGTFSVIGITEEGCKSYDTIKVNVFANPVVSLDRTSYLCTGSSRLLDAGNYSSYLWNDGSTSQKTIAKDIGIYAVEVRDANGCKGSDTTRITSILPLPSHFLPGDTLLCSYDKLSIKPLQAYSTYQWSTGASAPSLTVSQPGNYWLQVKDAKGCVGRDSITIDAKDCMKGCYVPTAFSPNKDGKNDLFRPMLFGRVKKFQFIVYNRWGQAVFQTTELNRAWDGKVAGVEQDPNVFVWVCNYQFEGEEEKTERGTVMLVR